MAVQRTMAISIQDDNNTSANLGKPRAQPLVPKQGRGKHVSETLRASFPMLTAKGVDLRNRVISSLSEAGCVL